MEGMRVASAKLLRATAAAGEKCTHPALRRAPRDGACARTSSSARLVLAQESRQLVYTSDDILQQFTSHAHAAAPGERRRLPHERRPRHAPVAARRRALGVARARRRRGGGLCGAAAADVGLAGA